MYFDRWGVIPAELFRTAAGRPAALPAGCRPTATEVPFLSVLTALFVHGSWLHLLGNMLFLYVFGDDVEDRMGRVGFALFYLAAGYLATLGYAARARRTTRRAWSGRPGRSPAVLGALPLPLSRGPG